MMKRILFFCNHIDDPTSYVEEVFSIKKDIPTILLTIRLIDWVKVKKGEDSINSLLVEYDYDELFH